MFCLAAIVIGNLVKPTSREIDFVRVAVVYSFK